MSIDLNGYEVLTANKKTTTNPIPFPFKSKTRHGVKHTADNRPECVHPNCSSTGKSKLAHGSGTTKKPRWRLYYEDNYALGGLCANCHVDSTPGLNPEEKARRERLAVERGFVTADGEPDLPLMYEHDRHELKVQNWKEYNKELGTNVKFEDYVKYVGQGESAYLMHRQDYCENKDGMATLTDGSHLGFTCRMTWPDPDFSPAELKRMRVLQVDHIDGNHLNNAVGPKCEKPNLQTLCSTCHFIKGDLNGDFQSPGRKTRNAEDYS